MLTYETLDAIADSVNPLLGVASLLLPWWKWRSRWRQAAWHVAVTLVTIAVIYGVFALDMQFGWWTRAGLDFSTHTAVCIGLLVALASLELRQAWLAAAVLLGYACLMVYQRYHTMADIATTAALILPLTIGLRVISRRFAPTSP